MRGELVTTALHPHYLLRELQSVNKKINKISTPDVSAAAVGDWQQLSRNWRTLPQVTEQCLRWVCYCELTHLPTTTRLLTSDPLSCLLCNRVCRDAADALYINIFHEVYLQWPLCFKELTTFHRRLRDPQRSRLNYWPAEHSHSPPLALSLMFYLFTGIFCQDKEKQRFSDSLFHLFFVELLCILYPNQCKKMLTKTKQMQIWPCDERKA